MAEDESLIIFEDETDRNWWWRSGLAVKILVAVFAITLLPLGYYAFATPVVPSCHVQPGTSATGEAPNNWFSGLF